MTHRYDVEFRIQQEERLGNGNDLSRPVCVLVIKGGNDSYRCQGAACVRGRSPP